MILDPAAATDDVASRRLQSRHPSNWSIPPRILLDLVFAAIRRPPADPSECAVSTLHTHSHHHHHHHFVRQLVQTKQHVHSKQ